MSTDRPETEAALEYLRQSADLYKRPDSLVQAKTREEALAAMEEWEQVLARLMVDYAKSGRAVASLRVIWASSPEVRELVKEIVAVGQLYLEDCDVIGMKDAGWKAKMPKLSQWLSICAKAKKMHDKLAKGV